MGKRGSPKEEGLRVFRVELFWACDAAEGHETPFVRDVESGRQWFVEELRKNQVRVGPQWFARDVSVEHDDIYEAWTMMTRLEPFQDLRPDCWSWYEWYLHGPVYRECKTSEPVSLWTWT